MSNQLASGALPDLREQISREDDHDNLRDNLPTTQIHVYNNVVFGWANESGLLIGEKIAHTLLQNEEQAKAAQRSLYSTLIAK